MSEYPLDKTSSLPAQVPGDSDRAWEEVVQDAVANQAKISRRTVQERRKQEKMRKAFVNRMVQAAAMIVESQETLDGGANIFPLGVGVDPVELLTKAQAAHLDPLKLLFGIR